MMKKCLLSLHITTIIFFEKNYVFIRLKINALVKAIFANQFILSIKNQYFMGVSQNYIQFKIPFVFTLTLKEIKGILNWFLCKNGIDPYFILWIKVKKD
jgi:hypothetical protein